MKNIRNTLNIPEPERLEWEATKKSMNKSFILKILRIQVKHDLQIIKEDGMYVCYIDDHGYGCFHTPMWALTVAVINHLKMS